MKIGEDFHRVYDSACEDLEDLGQVAESLLRALLKAGGLRPHTVTHRVKTESSLRRKLNEKGEQYSDLADVHDLLGARVITFFPDEVDAVAEIVEQEFEIDLANSVDKRAMLDPDRFGYLSMHYVASLNQTRAGLAEHAKFAGQKFEIQIRSILQHTWAEIEHDLGYQTPGAVPDSVRRRFSRLAGLLEVADDEFGRLRDDVAAYQSSVEKDLKASPEEVPINRDSIAAFVSSNSLVASLDEDLATSVGGVVDVPTDDSVYANARVTDLEAAGFKTIGEVEAALDEHQESIRRFFQLWAVGRITVVYRGLCLFYLAYIVVAQAGSSDEVARYLTTAHIGSSDDERSEISQRVIEVYREVS
jgi:putative GTP pyrophosphokinase